MATGNDNKLDYTVRVKAEGLEKLGRTLETTEDATKDLGAAATTAGAGLDKLNASADKAGNEIAELARSFDEKTQAIKAALQVEQSEIELQRQQLAASQSEQQAILKSATARGDESLATQAQNRLRQIEAEQLALSARAKRAEAEALQQTTDARREQMALVGPLTAAQASSTAAAENHAKALRVQADAADQAAQSTRDLGRNSNQMGSELAELKSAVDAKTAAIKNGLQVEQSAIELQRQHLAASQAEQQARLQAAQAKGDETAAIRARNALAQIEADQLGLVARAKRAEATATQQATAARREELAAVGPLTAAHAQELQAAENYARALRVEAAAADQAAARARELGSAHEQSTSIISRLGQAWKTTVAQFALGNLVSDLFTTIANKVGEMGREFVRANVEMDGMRRALTAIYKDGALAESQIAFLRKTANDAGVSYGSLTDSFKSFTASATAANIPLSVQNELFASVAQAGATLGLSGERLSQAMLALSQMASKGVVSMEELRGQLGESLPGALSLSAKGLGLTEAQLIKLVESGGLAARDLFPALAKSLREMQGETEGVTSSWERLKNALTISSQNAGDAGGMQLLTLSIKALGAVAAAVVLPLTAFAEVVFGVAKAAGVLVGSLVTLTNPLQALGEIADAASARQSALTDSFKALVFGADATAASQAKAGAAIAQTGRDAGAAAVGVGQVAQAHGAAAGAALTNVTAQNAAAIAAKIAGNASMDAGAKWVQLGVQLREIAAAQDQQIKNAEKLASAAKIEGDGLQALAALRGNDLESLQAASAASEANAAALDKVAAAREAQLATLSAELNAKKALIAGNAEEQKARETELQEIQKKIDALSAEASAGRAAAEAAKTDAAARRAAVGAYQDNAAAVGALRMALEQARIVQEAFESDRRRGLATDQQVEEAKRRTAEAQRLYNDALNDAVAAEQRSAAAKTSALQLERAGLDLQMAQARAAEAKAIADGNEYAATQARIKQKEIEIAAIKLVAAQLKAEADGMDAVTNKKIEALVLEGKWTDALAAEMQILRQSAEAKRKQAEETETSIAQRERELKALREGKFAHEDLARGMRNESSARFENQQAMRAQEDAMDRLNMRYKLSADYSERQIALLEREAAAAEKAAEAKRKYWNVDKDGFTLDANGQRQQMTVPTGEFVFNAAKGAGLTEAEALALMDKYFQNGKPTGVTAANGLNGPSRDWFSIVNDAISKAVIEKARQNAAGGGAQNSGPPVVQGGGGAGGSGSASATGGNGGGLSADRGGATYIANITIPGLADREEIRFADPISQARNESLLRKLAQAKSTAIR